MKKLFSLILSLAICLSAFAYDFEVDGLYYNIINDGEVEVTSGDVSYPDSVVVIPSSVTHNDTIYSVTAIGESAFYMSLFLTSVDIPNSVISIGNSAFLFTTLKSVTIGNSVTAIGDSAFAMCPYLTSVEIPNSVTYIGNKAFYLCVELASVNIPNSVTSIEDNTFSYCNLTSVDIPNSVTSIGNNAFYSCPLISVDIPNSVTSIGWEAFRNCTDLTSVVIPNSVTFIGHAAFQNCHSLTSVNIPNGVASIAESAFQNCYSMTSVTLGDNVTYVWEEAFAGCTGMTALICNTATPPSIQSNSFDNYNATLYVPDNSVALYQAADYWKNFNIMPLSRTQLDYTLEEKNVFYCNQIVYNENGLDITLFDASGRMITSGNGNIDMSNCPTGIYIVADGKGGSLKINHYR